MVVYKLTGIYAILYEVNHKQHARHAGTEVWNEVD